MDEMEKQVRAELAAKAKQVLDEKIQAEVRRVEVVRNMPALATISNTKFVGVGAETVMELVDALKQRVPERLPFDEVSAHPMVIQRLLNMLEARVLMVRGEPPTLLDGLPAPEWMGIRFSSNELGNDGIAWLLREGKVVGMWDLRAGEIVYVGVGNK